jgi:glycerol-3-phosphate dehydrogenase
VCSSDLIANKLDITVPVEYYQGTIVIRETLSHRGLQFFHEPEDADAYLVRNNEAWLGTTSVKIENPYSTISEPDVENFLTKKFSIILPEISKGAVHRKFVGIRALYKNIDSTSGRELTRDFKIIEQPEGFLHIIGGKLTTARLMAEKITDVVCEKSGVTSLCKTHLLPLV